MSVICSHRLNIAQTLSLRKRPETNIYFYRVEFSESIAIHTLHFATPCAASNFFFTKDERCINQVEMWRTLFNCFTSHLDWKLK